MVSRRNVWWKIATAAFNWYILLPIAGLGVFDTTWRFFLNDEQKETIRNVVPTLPQEWPWQGTAMLVLILVLVAVLEKSYRLIDEKDRVVEQVRLKRPVIKVRPKIASGLLRLRDQSFDLDEQSKDSFVFVLRNTGSDDAVDIRITCSTPSLNLRELLREDSRLKCVPDGEEINVFTRIELAGGGQWHRFELASEDEKRLDIIPKGEETEFELPRRTKQALILFLQEQALRLQEIQWRKNRDGSDIVDLLSRPHDVRAHREHFEQRQRELLILLPEIELVIEYSDHSGAAHSEEQKIRGVYSAIMGVGYAQHTDKDGRVSLQLSPTSGLLYFEDKQNPSEGMYQRFIALLGRREW